MQESTLLFGGRANLKGRKWIQQLIDEKRLGGRLLINISGIHPVKEHGLFIFYR